MTPQAIGRYRIVRQLGAGGMGEVYLAEDAALKRLVAIKVVAASDGDTASHARLVREAQAAATLDHPNVCAIYEVGEHGGRPFFAMQYIEGETLADRIAHGPPPLRELITIAEQVADALAQAHARTIVHRDIKPQNIMLQADRGLVKVLDFGLAKPSRLDHGGTTMPQITAAGTTAGTIAYMSPEQHRGGELTPATDVFSVGCVIHEMVGGTHPFARGSAAETIAAILGEEPAALPAATPAELQRIVRKCLEKDPLRRYATAHDLLVDLRNFARDSSAGLPRATTIGTPSRRRAAGIVASVAVVALVAVLAWAAFLDTPARNAGVRVIAILPLHTADAAAAFLGDGISESVLNSLSRLRQIKVLARTTTFRYRGANVDVAALRRDLGVDAVLTGTVQQQGDGLIIQAELIDTADGAQIWGQRYSNRRLADVFAVQEEIARDIAASLRLELADTAAFTKRYTQDVEAYRAYVLGRASAQDRTEKGLQAALAYYRQAINRDDRYALAWAGITDAYLVLAARGALPYSEARRLAAEAANRALALDPDLSEAHAAVGQTYVYAGPFDFNAGDQSLRRAIELNPGSPLPRQYLAVSLLEQGRLSEGVRELEISHDLDPLAGFPTRFLALGYMLQGDHARALKTYRAAADLGGKFSTPWEADLLVRAGAAEEELRAVETERGRDDDPAFRYNHAILNAAMGKREAAAAVATEFERGAAANPFLARYAARIHLALGDNDRGLALFEQSIRGGAVPIFYKDEPIFAPLRANPRFRALLKEMRIPD
ncbi:MAG TPA: protein kinase [Vicinamibacterales bacterium]|nr:protein kinase [Vicinamibacterales bacterium]